MMKYLMPKCASRGPAGALLLLLMLLASTTASALDPARIGFVDMSRILQETGIAQNSEAEAGVVVGEARAKLEQEQQAIQNMQQDFKRDEAILSQSQRDARQQEIQSRMQAYQQMAIDMQKEINRKKMQFAESALRPVQKAIQEIAGEEQLNAVFDRNDGALMFVDNSLDLTDRVIERLRPASR